MSEKEYRALGAKGLVAASGKPALRLVQRETLSLPPAGPDPGEVIFPFDLVNKANTYRILFHPRIQSTIQRMKRLYQGHWLWRIAPSEDAKAAQEALALKLQVCRFPSYLAGTAVQMQLRIGGHRLDIDALKLILDAVEDARILEDDNQVKLLTVRLEQGERSLGIKIEQIETDLAHSRSESANEGNEISSDRAKDREDGPRTD